jgi:hypothetical protein
VQEIRAIPDPAPAPSPWLWLAPTLAACGAAAVFALWLLFSGRAGPSQSTDASRLTRWRDRRAYPTRVALGAAILALAYHAAAWASPPSWLPFHVPVERWYLVAVPALVLIASAWWHERPDATGRGTRPEDRRPG